MDRIVSMQQSQSPQSYSPLLSALFTNWKLVLLLITNVPTLIMNYRLQGEWKRKHRWRTQHWRCHQWWLLSFFDANLAQKHLHLPACVTKGWAASNTTYGWSTSAKGFTLTDWRCRPPRLQPKDQWTQNWIDTVLDSSTRFLCLKTSRLDRENQHRHACSIRNTGLVWETLYLGGISLFTLTLGQHSLPNNQHDH